MICIIPAAGKAERMGGLPKMLLPIPGGTLICVLRQRMIEAGCVTCRIGASRSSYAFLRSDEVLRREIYKVETDTMSETVLLSQVDDDCCFGMADTYWTDDLVYETLIFALNHIPAIASVALWDVPRAYKNKRGMCAVKPYPAGYTIARIDDKPERTSLTLGWGAIVWRADFWKYIEATDPHVGFALQRAIEAGELVHGNRFDGRFYDCGTADEYFECIRALTGPLEPERDLVDD